MPFKYLQPIDRIIANSVRDELSDCWLWVGKTNLNRSGKRYPVLSIRWKSGKRRGKVRTVYAHRYVVSIVENIPLYKLRISMHLCDNTLCVNPDHLRRGTQRLNMLDMYAKGRHVGT